MRSPPKDVHKLVRENPVYMSKKKKVKSRIKNAHGITGAGPCYKIDGSNQYLVNKESCGNLT